MTISKWLVGLVFVAVVFSTVAMAQLPFIDTFDNTVTNRTTQTTGTFPTWTGSAIGTASYATTGRIRFAATTGGPTPVSGANHAVIDSPADGPDTAAAIDYSFDLSAFNPSTNLIRVSFQWADTGEETDDEDGVFYSLDNGATWNLLFDFDPVNNADSTYNLVSVDLSALLLAGSQSYTNQVVIRFQQQDNFMTPTDGIWFDDIQVYEDFFPHAVPSSGSSLSGNDVSGFDITLSFGAALTNVSLDCNDSDSATIDATITTSGAAPGVVQPADVTGGSVVFALAWTGTAGTVAGTYTYSVTLSDGTNQTTFDVRVRLMNPNVPGHLYYQLNEGTGSAINNLGGGGTPMPTFSAAPGWNTSTQQLGAAAVTLTGAESLLTGLTGQMDSDWTFEVWLRTTATAFGEILGDGSNSYVLGVDDGTVFVGAGRFVYADANGAVLGSSSIVNDGNWHHIAVTHDSSSGLFTLYVDASPEATETNGGVPGGTMEFGGVSGFAGFVGDLDEFRLWDVVRTQNEISLNFFSELGGSGPFAPVAGPASGSVFAGNYIAGFDASVSFGSALADLTLDCVDPDTASIDVTITTAQPAPGITQPSNVSAGAVPLMLSWTGTAGMVSGTYTYTVTLDDGGLQTTFDVRIQLFDASIPDLLYYKFNEGTGNTAANYASTSAAPAVATFSATPAWNTSTQQLGAAAVSFAGENLPTGINPGVISGDWTIEAWINTTSTATAEIVSDGGTFFIFRIQAGGTVEWGDFGQTITTTTVVNDGNWHHIALVRDTTTNTMSFFIDGVPDSGGNASATFSSPSLAVGGTASPPTLDMDEFRMWGRPLTQSEIQANMNVELPPPGDPEINLVDASGPTDWLAGSTQNIGSIPVGFLTTGTLTIENLGTTNNLDITNITATPTGVGNCSVSLSALSPASPIGPSLSATFDAMVTPTADGPFEFTLTITNNDVNEGTYEVVVQGTGTSPEIDVERIAGTSIADGGTDTVTGTVQSTLTTLTYTIGNDASATGDLNISNITVTAIAGCTAALNGGVPSAPITAGNTAAFMVDVTPSGAGAWSFTISIDNDDPDENPYNITVSGTAAATPVPQLQVDRNSAVVNSGGTDTVFGTVDATLTTLTYTATNIGSALLTFTGGTPVGITPGTGAPTVSVNTQPGSNTLSMGSGNTTFVIDVTPNGAGAWTATVAVASDDPASPYTFTISGTAQATAAPEMSVLRDGTTAITDGGTESQGNTGTAAFAANYTIRNEGAAALNLTGTAGSEVVISNTSNCSVVVSQPGSTSIATGGGTTTFTLTITPTAAGAFSFDVSIDNDDADENPYNWTFNGSTGGSGSSGGDDDDSGGCSTNTESFNWIGLLGLLGLVVFVVRARGSKV